MRPTGRIHSKTAGFAELAKGGSEIVQEYRRLLAMINRELVKLYRDYATDTGLLTYADIAARSAYDPAVHRLRDLVVRSFERRAEIVKFRIIRGTAAQYHDVLYQAERFIKAADIAGDARNTLAWKQYKKFPRPSHADLSSYDLEKMFAEPLPQTGLSAADYLARHGADSRARLVQAVESLWSATDGRTIEQAAGLMRAALERDAGRCLQMMYSNGARLVNGATEVGFRSRYVEVVREAFRAVQGDDLVQIWRHDQPQVPREWHVEMDGCGPDREGFFWSTRSRRSTTRPGAFGDPEEDVNCRCYLEVARMSEVGWVSTSAGIRQLSNEGYLAYLTGGYAADPVQSRGKAPQGFVRFGQGTPDEAVPTMPEKRPARFGVVPLGEVVKGGQ